MDCKSCSLALLLLNSVIKFNYFGINLRNRASMRGALAAVHTRQFGAELSLSIASVHLFLSLRSLLHFFIKKYRVTGNKKSRWMSLCE